MENVEHVGYRLLMELKKLKDALQWDSVFHEDLQRAINKIAIKTTEAKLENNS